MKTMQEVLAEHGEWRYTNGAGSTIVCRKCGAPVENVVEHQAAALSAAGFGLVADAKAEALEEAAALVASEQQHQFRRDSQRLPGAHIVAQRMGVLVNIIRARAARAKATP